jgi:hypothetical protein
MPEPSSLVSESRLSKTVSTDTDRPADPVYSRFNKENSARSAMTQTGTLSLPTIKSTTNEQ